MGRRPRFRDQSLGSILARLASILWLRYVAQRPAAPRPARVVTGAIATDAAAAAHEQSAAATPATQAPYNLAWLLLAFAGVLAVVVVASVVVLINLYGTPGGNAVLHTGALASPTANIAASLPTSAPLVVPAGQSLTASRVLGTGATGGVTLAQPQEAVRGAGGVLYVADTGNRRVVVLDAHGHLLRAITAGPGGPLQAPFSLAVTAQGQLLVLDSDAGQVIEYDAAGTVLRSSSKALTLTHARGIGLDAKGNVLVADPASASVVTLGPDLTPLQVEAGKDTNGTVRFLQPSAVAVGKDGTIYVVDGQANRLLAFGGDWTLQRAWSIPGSDTEHSPRPLPLAGGKVLVSDPTDSKLLLYDPAGDQPQAYALSSRPGAGLVPLGLAALDRSTVLVTLYGVGQVWQVRLPGL